MLAVPAAPKLGLAKWGVVKEGTPGPSLSGAVLGRGLTVPSSQKSSEADTIPLFPEEEVEAWKAN